MSCGDKYQVRFKRYVGNGRLQPYKKFHDTQARVCTYAGRTIASRKGLDFWQDVTYLSVDSSNSRGGVPNEPAFCAKKQSYFAIRF